MTGLTAFEVEGLRVEFGGDASPLLAVRDVSFAVSAGETLAVVGESGSGKSVTALAAMGLLDPPGRITAGDVRLGGRSLVGLRDDQYRLVRGSELAMVFQDPLSALNPVLTIGAQVAEAVTAHGGGRAAGWKRALEMLERVGVAPAARLSRAYPHELSGGMRQRVLLAMALANEPKVLIADEPTTALDVTTQAQILDLVAELQREMGLAVVLVSHDLGVVAGIADRVVVMYAGRVVESGTTADLFTRAGHPYARGLLASVPRVDDARGTLSAIPGTPPDPARLPSGCAFHPRCPLAVARCRDAVPPDVVLSGGHVAACIFADEVSSGSPVG